MVPNKPPAPNLRRAFRSAAGANLGIIFAAKLPCPAVVGEARHWAFAQKSDPAR